MNQIADDNKEPRQNRLGGLGMRLQPHFLSRSVPVVRWKSPIGNFPNCDDFHCNYRLSTVQYTLYYRLSSLLTPFLEIKV